MNLNYRADIDGLRAVAVMAVVLGHCFPEYVPGGFVGVDVFFVISGFLITGIIQREIAAGTFSIWNFYRRRIRRIFPALIIVLICSMAAAYVVFDPAAMASLGKHVIAGVGFVSNLLLHSEVGYFDADASSKPLLHLWSLGVEEQFYIVWPLLLLALWRLKARSILPIILILAASFVASIAFATVSPHAGFYLPITRAWELAAGALLAFLPQQIRLPHERLALGGVTCIAAAIALYSSATSYPGFAALLPVCGAAALIVARDSSFNRRVLGSNAAVSIGLISYPLYLWHWPVLTFAPLFKRSPLTLAECGLVIGASLLLAWATYRLLETPVRVRRGPSARWLAAATAPIALIALAATIDGFEFRIPEEVRGGTLSVSRDFTREGECHISTAKAPTFSPDCIPQGRSPAVLIWGDSTAGMLAAGFRQLPDRGFSLAQLTVNSCPPTFSGRANETPLCVATNMRILANIAETVPDTVILHAAWDNSYTSEVLSETAGHLRAAGVRRVILVGPVPYWTGNLPQIQFDYFRKNRKLLADRITDHLVKHDTDRHMQAAAGAAGIEYFSARSAFCNSDGCLTRVAPGSAGLVSADFIHLSPPASKYLATKMINSLNLKLSHVGNSASEQ